MKWNATRGNCRTPWRLRSKSLEHLFVYGTLRRGLENEHSRRLSQQATFLGNGRMAGRLYQIDRYSGAIRSDEPGEWVHGEVYLLEDPGQMLPNLDRYEGEEFERVIVAAQLDSGEWLETWVYLYRGKAAGKRIESGDWLNPQ